MLEETLQSLDPDKTGKLPVGAFRNALAQFGVKSGVNPIVRRFQRPQDNMVDYRAFLTFFEQARAPATRGKAGAMRSQAADITRSGGTSGVGVDKETLSVEEERQVKPNKVLPQVQTGHDVTVERKRRSNMLGYQQPSSFDILCHEDEGLLSRIRALDTQKSGLIPMSEFRRQLEEKHVSADDRMVEELVSRCRSGGDQVDYPLFFAYLRQPTGEKSGSWSVPSQSSSSEAQSGHVSRKRRAETPSAQSPSPSPLDNTLPKSPARQGQVVLEFSKADIAGTGVLPREQFVSVLRTVNPAVSPADADLLASKLADPATGTIDYKRFVAATAQAQSTMLDPTPAGASSTNSEESVAGTLESGSTSARGPGRSLRRAVEQQSKIFSPEVEPVSPSCRKAREDNINVTTPKARDPLTWDPARKLNAEETELHKLQEEMKDKLFGRTSTMLESFRSFDVSGEGTISYPEFHRGLERIGVSISEEKSKRLFDHVDVKGNGKVDYQEWARALAENDSGEAVFNREERRLFTGGTKGGIDKRFSSSESDPFFVEGRTDKECKDTFVRKSNFFKTKSSEHLPLHQNEEAEKQIQMRLLRQKLMDAAERKSKNLRSLFLHFDANSDGVIQFEEFKRGVREMVAISDPEMDQLVKIADSNKDGVIDYNEFVRVMQLDNQSLKPDPFATSALKKQRSSGKKHAAIPKSDPFNLEEPSPSTRQAELSSSSSPVMQSRQQLLNPNRESPKVVDEESTTERKDSRLRRKITDRLFDRAEEVVQHLSKYDKKGTGALSPEKFRKGLQSLGVELTFPEMERLTMYLDPEHRGRINYQEFANAVLGDGGETAAIAPSAQRSPVSSTGASRMDLAMRREISDRLEAKSSKLSSVFRLMDTDSSGLLTKDQFRDGMTTIGVSLRDADLEAVFSRFDQTGSGKINFEEFSKLVLQDSDLSASVGPSPLSTKKTSRLFVPSATEQQERHSESALRNKLSARFSDLMQGLQPMDPDNVGLVTMDELQAVATRLHIDLSVDEKSRVLRLCDVDRNGTIDLQEFQKVFHSRPPLPRSPAVGAVRSVTGGSPPASPSSASFSAPTEEVGGSSGQHHHHSPQPAAEESAAGASPPATDPTNRVEDSGGIPLSLDNEGAKSKEGSPDRLTDRRQVKELMVTVSSGPSGADTEGSSSGAAYAQTHAPVLSLLKSELESVTQKKPLQLRESFRAVDTQRKGRLSEEKFRDTLLRCGLPKSSEWLVDSAVAVARTPDGGVNYDQVLRHVGFDLPHDERQFAASLEDVRHVLTPLSEGAHMAFQSPPATSNSDPLQLENTWSPVTPRRIKPKGTTVGDSGDILTHQGDSRSQHFSHGSRKHVPYSPSNTLKRHPNIIDGRSRTPKPQQRMGQTGSVVGSPALLERSRSAQRVGRMAEAAAHSGPQFNDTEFAVEVMKRAKSAAVLADHFSTFDREGKGTVSYREFRRGLQSTGVRVADEKLLDLLRTFDPQGSGRIDYRNFSRCVGSSFYSTIPDKTAERNSRLSGDEATPVLGQSQRFLQSPKGPAAVHNILSGEQSSDYMFDRKKRSNQPPPQSPDASMIPRGTKKVQSPHNRAHGVIEHHEHGNEYHEWLFSRKGAGLCTPTNRSQDLLKHSEESPTVVKRGRRSVDKTAELRQLVQSKIAQSHPNMSSCFRDLNTSGTGILTASEMREGMRHKMNLELTEGQAERLLRICGAKNNLGVTFTQFASAMSDPPMSPLGSSASMSLPPSSPKNRSVGSKNCFFDNRGGAFMGDDYSPVNSRRNKSSDLLASITGGSSETSYQTPRSASTGRRASPFALRRSASSLDILTHDMSPTSTLPPRSEWKEIGVVVQRARPLTPQAPIPESDFRHASSPFRPMRFSTPPPVRRNPMF